MGGILAPNRQGSKFYVMFVFPSNLRQGITHHNLGIDWNLQCPEVIIKRLQEHINL